jgi:hypothetical protein
MRQRVIGNLGRVDELAASGALASVIASGAKLTDQVLLISALDHDAEGALSASAKRIGGPLLFGRIWERLGIADVLGDLLRERAFEFAVERAVFIAALHRLFVSGSDRDCASWIEDRREAVRPPPQSLHRPLCRPLIRDRRRQARRGGALRPHLRVAHERKGQRFHDRSERRG